MRRGGLGFCSRCGKGERGPPCRILPPRRGLTSPQRRGGVGELQGGDVRQGGKELVVIAARVNVAPPAAYHLRAARPPDLGAEAR
jgi:hypothetical protein